MDICKGCGSLIQFTDKTKQGFIKEDVYKKRISENKEILCERCFRLKHYNEVEKVTIDEDSFLKMVKDKVMNNMLICYIVDLFDLDGTIIKNINEIFPHNEILVIGNKYDLFSRSNRPTKLKKYLNNYLEDNNIETIGSIITSATDEYSAKKVYESILKIINNKKLSHEVFFFGMSNAGKTTFLKSMGELFNNEEAKSLITSKAISTTLGLKEIDLGELKIIDSPGLINNAVFTYYLNKKTIDYIMPKSMLKPRIFQLNSYQSIFIEGFAKISLLDTVTKTSAIVNVANNIKLHRTKYQDSDIFYEKHLNDLFVMPNKQERSKLGDLKKVKYNIGLGEEISICGLGFVSFNQEVEVEVTTFEKIKVVIRKKII